NNLLEISGADGILATRNVSGIKILENIITHSGEHGIYFQGDNSVIENNIVRLSRGSGIKLGSYTSDLYFYDDETVISDYVGYNNLISGNICSENGLNGEVNAGIYLQSGLDNIIVETNFTYNNTFGIRSVHL